MITSLDLFKLEHYSKIRDEFRTSAIEHRRKRQIAVGPNCTFSFEDIQTIKYQIQEMLYIEKSTSPLDIQHEIDAYSPLVPKGTNLCATMTLEFGDPEIRKTMLQILVKCENTVFIRIAGHPRVYAYADEDLERSTEQKTSSVHFLRFEFEPGQVVDFKDFNNKISLGIGHDLYPYEVALSDEFRTELIRDFA